MENEETESDNFKLQSNISGHGNVNLNSCLQHEYELLVASLLHCTPLYPSLQKQEIDREVESFYKTNKRRFYDKNCTKRPIYVLKINNNGEVDHDKNGVAVVMVNTYVKGEITQTRQLLYTEAVEDVLQELHCVPVTLNKMTCLPGGINALSKMFNAKYLFKGSFNIIKLFLSNCENCRVNIPLPSTIKPPPIPIRTFKPHYRLQCDLIDMAPKKYRSFMAENKWGYRYILTVKCCFSKFCWIFPITSKSADEVFKILRLLFIKEGAPTILQSDNGGEFIAGVIKKLCQDFKVHLVHGRPYHPQSQGQVENLNKQVKKCLARFLQKVRRDQQANLWPILLSGIADFLNSKWHSTIDDIPFRVYRNREPSSQTSHIVPDDEFLKSSLEEQCLSDFEFGEQDILPEFQVTTNHNENVFQDMAKITCITSDTILASSFGTLSDSVVNLLQSVMTPETTTSSSKEQCINDVDSADCFETTNITQFLGQTSTDYKVLTCDVLEATEYTIQRNLKRSRCDAQFKVGDKVVYKVQQMEQQHLKSKDPFQSLNEIGVVEEVLPGGMYKVHVDDNEGCSLFVKCVYSGQMVKLSHDQCQLSSSKHIPQFSLLSLHNSISEYGSTVRREMYNLKLRSCVKRSPVNIDNMFQKYSNILDFGFLAMVSSLLNKDDTSYFHNLFTSGIKELKDGGFKYFLYGTIHWERERKQKLSRQIAMNLSTMSHSSECSDCLKGDVDKPCFHSCCQEMVLQLGLKSGLIKKDDNGEISLSLSCKGPAPNLPHGPAPNLTPRPANHMTPGPDPNLPHGPANHMTPGPVPNLPHGPANHMTPGPVPNLPHGPANHMTPGPVPNLPHGPANHMTPGPVPNLPHGSAPNLTTKPASNLTPSSILISEPTADQTQTAFDKLKEICLENIMGHDEFHVFSESLDILLAECSEEPTVLQNLNYMANIVGKHSSQHAQQVCVKSSNGIWMQTQGYSSYCGLCAMNNALCLPLGSLPVFSIQDLDLAADIMWLKQSIVGSTFSMVIEPMRFLDGDYSIMAMEQAALMKNMTFQRLDAAVRALTDGICIENLNSSSFGELYKLFLQTFDDCAEPSLIIRIRNHHYVTLVFNKDHATLLDSRTNAPMQLPPLKGMLFLQRECQDNPLFAAINIALSGTKGSPLDVDELPDVEVVKDFKSSLEDIWQENSPVSDDTIVSDKHGTVKARDMRSLKSGCLVNDPVINYIGQFLMSHKQDVFVANTFWLIECSQRQSQRLVNCDFNHHKKFIFPIHCPGHWWCVLIDITAKVYWEYDSLCRERDSLFVFDLLSNIFLEAKIDLHSFKKLTSEERKGLPSQGSSSTDCGVYLLYFMSLFASGDKIQCKTPCISTMRQSFSHMILNGRPPSDQSSNIPTTTLSYPYAASQCSTTSTVSSTVTPIVSSTATPIVSSAATPTISSAATSITSSSDATFVTLDIHDGISEPLNEEEDDDGIFNVTLLPPLSPVNCNPTSDLKETDEIISCQNDEMEYRLLDLLRPPQEAREDIDNLEAMYPERLNCSVFMGLVPLVERYLEERPKKVYPRGNYHVIFPKEEVDQFDLWRKAHKAKTRGIFDYVRWNLTLEKWLETDIPKKQDIMARRDKDGWVPLDLTESTSYQNWCEFTWISLKKKHLE